MEDSDRLVNLVIGRSSKELDGFNWTIGLKNGAFPGYRIELFGFFGFPKKEKLIDTGFFPFGFSGFWISNLLDGLVFLDIE